MGDGDYTQFPKKQVFDQASNTVQSGLDPLVRSPTQLADLGVSALAVGMFPTGLELAAAIAGAFGTATLAHQNHSKNVQDAIEAISASGDAYHKSEDDSTTAVERIWSAFDHHGRPDVQI